MGNLNASNPQISVVMSVYNEENFIGAAIKSILIQTYPHFEFIIIDDGSTDSTGEIIKSFNDERIIYKKIENVIFSKALNVGISVAKYDLIARMDGDDIALPERFEKQISFLKNNPDVKILSSAYAFFIGDSVTQIYHPFQEDSEIKRKLNYQNPLTHPGIMFNKAHAAKYNFYNESLDCFEDVDLWQRMRADTKFKNLDEVLILRRLKENSLTNFEYTKPKEFIEKVFFKNFDRKYYNSDTEADIDYALLIFRYSSMNEFRKHVFEKYIFFNPKILFLYLWSFISRKNILEWMKWKIISIKTFFSTDKKIFENLIKSLND